MLDPVNHHLLVLPNLSIFCVMRKYDDLCDLNTGKWLIVCVINLIVGDECII